MSGFFMSLLVALPISASRNRFYIGSSEKPGERLKKHNTGHTSSKESSEDKVIVYLEEFNFKKEEKLCERMIKNCIREEPTKRLTGFVHTVLSRGKASV